MYSLASGATSFCELNMLPAELTKHITCGLRYLFGALVVLVDDVGVGVEVVVAILVPLCSLVAGAAVLEVGLIVVLLPGVVVMYLGLPEQQHRSPSESLEVSRRNMQPFRA